jgi:twitching motility protein PilT
VNHINENRQAHIITIEDPIEFVHQNQQSLVNQREVSSHTKSFANALKATLREDPDIILLGEMRDLETIQLAITAAETGHLVFGTLHTSSAHKTVDRIIDVFPSERQDQVRTQLAESLRGVIAQTLLTKADGAGRVAAFEVMFNNKAIANLIREGKTFQIPSTMQVTRQAGNITFEQSLQGLLGKNLITKDQFQEALGMNESDRKKDAEESRANASVGAVASAPAPTSSGQAGLSSLAERFKKKSG